MVRNAFERNGVRVFHVSTQDRRSVSNMGVLDLRNIALGILHAVRTATLAARERPDLVYVPISQVRWGFVRDAVLMTILRALRLPFVARHHGSRLQDFYHGAGRLERLMIRRTLGWSERALVLTPNLAHLFDGLVEPERVRVLENGSPDLYPDGVGDIVAARRERARCAPQALRLLYVANDWTGKGAATLVRALGAPELRGAELHLAGAPPAGDRVAVLGLARELGVADRVRELGEISGPAKADAFAWADVLVHPTEDDGQPLVIIEAMAAALPIVTTPVAGIPHTTGGTALIVAPRSPDELAAALATLIADPELRLRLGVSARRRYDERYAEGPFDQRFVEVFAEVVPLNGSAS
jgi:glycosyltransferase involved in cell wall biosynthesis